MSLGFACCRMIIVEDTVMSSAKQGWAVDRTGKHETRRGGSGSANGQSGRVRREYAGNVELPGKTTVSGLYGDRTVLCGAVAVTMVARGLSEGVRPDVLVIGDERWARKSSRVSPAWCAISRRRKRGRSRVPCTGTVVALPSGCRNRLWEPRWRTSRKPSAVRVAMTSRGVSAGVRDITIRRGGCGCRRIGFRVPGSGPRA